MNECLNVKPVFFILKILDLFICEIVTIAMQSIFVNLCRQVVFSMRKVCICLQRTKINCLQASATISTVLKWGTCLQRFCYQFLVKEVRRKCTTIVPKNILSLSPSLCRYKQC